MNKKVCNSCGKEIHISAIKCRYCLCDQPEIRPDELIITSGHSFEGYEIIEYIDFVSEDTFYYSTFLEDIKAEVKDFIGVWKQSKNNPDLKGFEIEGTQELIKRGREHVFENFKRRVKDLNANAVIGFDVDAVVGSKIMKISVNGTAVYIVRKGTKGYEIEVNRQEAERVKIEEERQRFEDEKKKTELLEKQLKYKDSSTGIAFFIEEIEKMNNAREINEYMQSIPETKAVLEDDIVQFIEKQADYERIYGTIYGTKKQSILDFIKKYYGM